MGVPYDFMPQVMQALGDIGNGFTVTRACMRANISVSTFRRVIKSSTDWQNMFADAEQQGHDLMAEALLSIDTHDEYGSTDPKQQKVISDNIKWFLARKRPQLYGDRVTVTHEVTLDRAITEALNAGKERALISARADAIDVDYTVVPAAPVEDDPYARFTR